MKIVIDKTKMLTISVRVPLHVLASVVEFPREEAGHELVHQVLQGVVRPVNRRHLVISLCK